MSNIKIDFNNVIGDIKPLHGVNNAPYSTVLGANQTNVSKYFNEAHIPYCRLHDCVGEWGGGYFIDVTNIFRDFDADEANPDSYDFHYSDEYIQAIADTGCSVYYRLGVTIEWGSKKYASVVPTDFEKWARICEHIIRHYNEGWANGFELGIKYWEIWNEPENPGNQNGLCMWQGTKEEFFELYKVASKHLRACFPDILIGGCGGCGFYTLTRENNPDGFETFIPYFIDFLEMVKKENCPLDFYSWHIYTDDEKELLTHAKYVRETLDKYGFNKTESHLNEWNYGSEGTSYTGKHDMRGASFDAAVLCMLQNNGYVDKAMYYCFSNLSRYNGFFNQNDGTIDPPWLSFVAFGKLYELGNSVAVSSDSDGIYSVAAKNFDSKAVLVSNYSSEDENICISLKGLDINSIVSIKLIDENKRLDEIISYTANSDTNINITLKKTSILYIEIGLL